MKAAPSDKALSQDDLRKLEKGCQNYLKTPGSSRSPGFDADCFLFAKESILRSMVVNGRADLGLSYAKQTLKSLTASPWLQQAVLMSLTSLSKESLLDLNLQGSKAVRPKQVLSIFKDFSLHLERDTLLFSELLEISKT